MPYHLAMSPRKFVLERETGFEPATSTLARLHSTTELLPRGVKKLIGDSGSSVNRKNGCRRIFLHHAGQPGYGRPCIGGREAAGSLSEGLSFSCGGHSGRKNGSRKGRVAERPVSSCRNVPCGLGRGFWLPEIQKKRPKALFHVRVDQSCFFSSSRCFFSSSSRRARRSTLPTMDLGSSSRNSKMRGTL